MKFLLLNALAFSFLIIWLNGYGQCPENEIINQRKIAIVFGEQNYKYSSPLTNSLNDAQDITDSLKKVGFLVTTFTNVDGQTMNQAIDSWCDRIKGFDVALFYFSGHGAEVGGENFLFPTDINPKGPSDLLYSAYSANKVLDRMNNSGLKYSIMILDACRNNPFTKGWSRGDSHNGLSQMSGKGSYVAFAAAPGQTASDGTKRNGAYTEGILKYITKPDLTIDEIFTRVSSYVKKTTSGQQTPFRNTSLDFDYCFSVSRKSKTAMGLKPPSFLQPASGLSLSNDGSYLFSIEPENENIVIRDTKTLTISAVLIHNTIKPAILTSRNKQFICVLDSINRTVNVIDWKVDKSICSIKLDFVPTDLVPSMDGRKLYVCSNMGEGGKISVIDLPANKISNSIIIKAGAKKMVMSNDGKRLYTISDGLNGSINIIDVKNEKLMRENLSISGKALGVTPDSKKLYAISTDNTQIKVIDLNNFTLLKTLTISAHSLAFSNDSKYLFALTNSKVSIIRVGDDFPVINLPFLTTPKALALANDIGFIWLPQEKRIFTFSLENELKNAINELDPEVKLNKFKEQINKDPSYINSVNKMEACGKITQLFNTLYASGVVNIISQLNYELSKGLQYKVVGNSNLNVNCENSTGNGDYGIYAVNDSKKKIFPNFAFQTSENEVVLTVQDPKIDNSPEVLRIMIKQADPKNPPPPFFVAGLLDKPNQDKFKKFIRDYFARRIEYLQ